MAKKIQQKTLNFYCHITEYEILCTDKYIRISVNGKKDSAKGAELLLPYYGIRNICTSQSDFMKMKISAALLKYHNIKKNIMYTVMQKTINILIILYYSTTATAPQTGSHKNTTFWIGILSWIWWNMCYWIYFTRRSGCHYFSN